MYMVFPADEKLKKRLDTVCRSLNISLEEWFESALKASEFDVLINLLTSPKDQVSWMWDEKIGRFVRRSDVE
ncbi:hypothetical protein Desaci_1597 [Desulfosporosinus acidiphilus SJ4]|uniref:Uncharacterized protein n=1 Tax=Desulfosporosinus acidiphilus (strain DSM 22704 / JCM 16185 / SJ4) TaxID=646529 RepID=I4D477_DESAJ|nr:hypothetical protein [Desulfosporosinus acidiphilus]AFM40601.1 hypothetical protein Desaci_1597 [Desulfosporosinus acidiphilus SJ4]